MHFAVCRIIPEYADIFSIYCRLKKAFLNRTQEGWNMKICTKYNFSYLNPCRDWHYRNNFAVLSFYRFCPNHLPEYQVAFYRKTGEHFLCPLAKMAGWLWYGAGEWEHVVRLNGYTAKGDHFDPKSICLPFQGRLFQQEKMYSP